jgi:hypothetical protein
VRKKSRRSKLLCHSPAVKEGIISKEISFPISALDPEVIQYHGSSSNASLIPPVYHLYYLDDGIFGKKALWPLPGFIPFITFNLDIEPLQ